MMNFTTRPTLRGTFGMVSSTHWLASQAGMAELEAGGNAFDAAVAAAFVLHVVEPHLNGPGGDMVALLATAQDPAPVVLCGQGPAPRGATIAHYRDLGLDLVPGAGLLAAAVPGAVDAWLTLLRDSGTRPLREVLSYAIGYAANGHPIAPLACLSIASVAELFTEHWPASAAQWLPGGRPPTPYALVRQPAWARTLTRLVTEAELAGAGREAQIEAALAAWRTGFVAETIDVFCRNPYRDSSGRDHAGVLTGADMVAFRPAYEPPVTAPAFGHTIAKAGPWSQGPVLLQTLALLEGLPHDPGTAEGAHTIAEAIKLAFADRDAWYGDSGKVPVAALLDAQYAARRRALICADAADGLRPGAPDGYEPSRPPRHVTDLLDRGAGDSAPGEAPGPGGASGASGAPMLTAEGEPAVSRYGEHSGDTCHVDVVDRWGNIIAATPSGGWLQSSPIVPELGLCLGTRLQMCWLEDGLPASLAPGRRPRTTLTPTLVLRDGRPVLACGSPGGDQQDQWQLLFLLRYLGGGHELQEAIDAPMWHSTALAGSFYPRELTRRGLVVEERLGAEAVAELRRRGHEVTVSTPWSLGRMCATARDPESGLLSAGANPRGMQGYACGR
jgi:gamma-glutamyltranspeptidase/glutathione hydrolase